MRQSPPSSRRALVLGGGGHAGIAWEIGVVLGLLERGIDVSSADLLIGTSAGSIVATHLALDGNIDDAVTRLSSPEAVATGARMGPAVLLRYLAAGLRPGTPASQRAWLSRGADRAAVIDEDSFVSAVALGIEDADWPDRDLMVTAVRADTGEAVAFTKDSGVPLARAVAASCAVPLVYPPVTIHGHRYVDGGIRTVTNADMAVRCDRVVVIAPVAFAIRKAQRPRAQLAGLGSHVRSTCVVPDERSLEAMGRNLLDPSTAGDARRAGVAQGATVAPRVADVWGTDLSAAG
jgi:NTE family protein